MVHREASIVVNDPQTMKQIEEVLSPQSMAAFDKPALTRDFTHFARMRDSIAEKLKALPPPPGPALPPTFAPSQVTGVLERVATQIDRAATP
jgi:hypothetical protein